MRSGEDAVALFLSLFAAFVLVNGFSIYYFDIPLLPVVITGNVVDSGLVDLYVQGDAKTITIHYPLNSTYNFNIGDPYLFELNVTADFPVDNWTYSLYDERPGHDISIEENTNFTPNGSFVAVRWNNNLTINAHETGGSWYSSSVFFYVSVPNSAPILGAISDQIYFCEGTSADERFNATDADEDVPTPRIEPWGPYIYAFYIGKFNDTVNSYHLVSNLLDEGQVGFYDANISVEDSEYSDTANTNITVIELNDAPSVPSIGTQTVYKTGENSTFYYGWAVNDEEDGNNNNGLLDFNISWEFNENFFNISEFGVMNFTVSGEPVQTYSVTVCVNDTALASPHPNITGQCSSDGSSNTNCDTFNFVITDDNRPPRIDSYIPLTTNFSVDGTASTTFVVNVSDPDMDGFYPDIDWYVNDVLREHVENEPTDSFGWSYGCGFSGDVNITAVTTDGLSNDSQVWEVSVDYVACPIESSSGGGGGGGGSLNGACNEQWVCNDFEVCQDISSSLDANVISPGDYSDFLEICTQKGLSRTECGFQITSCFDLQACNNSVPRIAKPIEAQACHYSENPSCRDGIKNCHTNSCELLVDCGGPCNTCPTCTDGIQNQGESNIDCGGACPFICEPESPYRASSYLIIVLFLFSVVIVLFILYKVVGILRYSFLASKKKKKSSKK